MDPQIRYRRLRNVSLASIAANCALALAKTAAGLWAGSDAVVSDGVHSLSDVLTTVLVMAGLKLSSEAPDDAHPYGHQRFESIVSFIMGGALALIALYMGYRGAAGLWRGTHVEPSWFLVGITILSIAVKEAMFQYTARAAKKLESTSMLADAWHHRSDAVSSVAVLIGLTGLFFGLWYLEPVATLAVSGIILAAAAQIVKTAVGQLTDRSAEKRLCDDMWEAAQAVPGVDAVDTLRTRVSSSVIFVEIEIAICADASVLAAHDIAEQVEAKIKLVNPSVAHCSVHVNPLPDGGTGTG